jgi:uncharacterized small protein (DUF1192 family)
LIAKSGLKLIREAAMINPDELDPPRKAFKLRDLEPMSVGELKEYITSLQTEIERAKSMITKKETHKSGIEAIFGASN